jgi:hypothetical protein
LSVSESISGQWGQEVLAPDNSCVISSVQLMNNTVVGMIVIACLSLSACQQEASTAAGSHACCAPLSRTELEMPSVGDHVRMVIDGQGVTELLRVIEVKEWSISADNALGERAHYRARSIAGFVTADGYAKRFAESSAEIAEIRRQGAESGR